MSESKILTIEEVAKIEARERLATKGPWTKYYRVSPRGAHKQWHIGNKDGACQITMTGHERDYDFMAHAREDVPALCATVRHLQKDYSDLAAANRWLLQENEQLASELAKTRQHRDDLNAELETWN